MKKIICIALILAVCFSLAACGKISSEKAIDICLKDLGINRVAAARTDAVLDESGEKPVYNVVIDRNDFKNVFVIDAKTGEIISSEKVESGRK